MFRGWLKGKLAWKKKKMPGNKSFGLYGSVSNKLSPRFPRFRGKSLFEFFEILVCRHGAIRNASTPTCFRFIEFLSVTRVIFLPFLFSYHDG